MSLRNRALAHLARREHSRPELAAKLERAGGTPDDIATLLDEFEACGWLSDRRFAESYIADHRARDGAIKIAHALRQRGVKDSLIAEVIAKLEPHGESEVERARTVWRKKFKSPPATAPERAKQMRFLQGRGFSMATIRSVMADNDHDD